MHTTASVESPGVIIHARDELHLLATYENVVMTMWRGAPTVRHLQGIRPVQRRLTERFPSGTGVINLIARGSAAQLNMTSEAKKEATQQSNETARTLVGMAYIIEGGGFWAATVRSVINAVNLLSRTTYPQKVSEEDGPAAEFLAPLLKQPVTSDALLQAIRFARARLEETRPAGER